MTDNEIPLAKILRPSFDEFVGFEQFVENIDRDKSLQEYGLVKVMMTIRNDFEISLDYPSCKMEASKGQRVQRL